MSLVEKIDGVADAVGFDANGVGASGILNAEAMFQYGNIGAGFASCIVGGFILYFALENFVDVVNAYLTKKSDAGEICPF